MPMNDRASGAGEPGQGGGDGCEEGPPESPQDKAGPVGRPKEVGGSKGPEPTRYGDWQHRGRCTDF
jgi:hypothetical protein